MLEPSPWSNPKDPHILFPINSYDQLLNTLNYPNHNKWLNSWNLRGGIKLADYAWPDGTKTDWFWGLGLPLLSDIERCLKVKDQKTLFGITGLPGCGKTSLGKWLEAAANELNWPIKVISLDDFYLPSRELDKAMAGNPWNVPRALPGSHSIQLLKETIQTWRSSGNLRSPHFDKALRKGLGDRSGWSFSKPKVLVIEGWFLGCELAKDLTSSKDNLSIGSEPITSIEQNYRVIVQKELKNYQPIWHEFDRVWHIKAINFSSTRKWKRQQEENLQKERGASIKGMALDHFNRMIETAIPVKNLQTIKSDVVIKLSSNREILWVGLSN